MSAVIWCPVDDPTDQRQCLRWTGKRESGLILNSVALVVKMETTTKKEVKEKMAIAY